MRKFLPLIAAALFATPALADEQAGEEAAIMLSPASPWQASFKDGLCRLGRIFGPKDNRHALTIEQTLPASTVDIMLAGPAADGFKRAQTTSFAFIEDQTPMEAQAFVGKVEGFGPAVMVEQLSLGAEGAPSPFGTGIDTEFVKDFDQLLIAQPSHAVLLETGALRDAFQVMNDCTAHALRTLGLDPDQLSTASRGVKLTSAQQVSQRILSDYPLRALKNNEQGKVGVLLKVDENGKVYDCSVVAKSGSPTLDKAACKGMRSAKFEPALDANGAPIRSYYSTAITYRLN